MGRNFRIFATKSPQKGLICESRESLSHAKWTKNQIHDIYIGEKNRSISLYIFIRMQYIYLSFVDSKFNNNWFWKNYLCLYICFCGQNSKI